MNGHSRDAVEQIRPEVTPLDLFVQFAIRGANNPNLDLLILLRSDKSWGIGVVVTGTSSSTSSNSSLEHVLRTATNMSVTKAMMIKTQLEAQTKTQTCFSPRRKASSM